MKKFNKKFLFITFAIIFIIVLISIFSVSIIRKKTNDDALKASETNARNRLYNVLSLASNEKENNTEYNSESFLTNMLISNGLIVNGNIVSLDNWNFEIDRENLSINNNLGATKIIFNNDVINYFTGTTSDGQKIVTAQINVNSNIPLDKIIFENNDGTFTTEEINNTSYSKDINLLLDKKYLITAVAKDGKTKLETFQEFSAGKFDSLLTVADKCIKKDGVYNVSINGETYGIHAYVYEGDTVISSNTSLGDANDVATSLTNYNAKNMVLMKVNGNLTVNADLTAFSNTYGGPKGFFIYCTGTLTNNSTITMSKKGANANGQNVYLWKNANDSYEYVPASGANGGSGQYAILNSSNKTVIVSSYSKGSDGNNRKTAGGGGGIIGVGSVRNGSSMQNGGDGSAGTSYGGGCGGRRNIF